MEATSIQFASKIKERERNASEFNANGPAKRNAEQWKKALCDSKGKKIKKKMHINEKSGSHKLHFLETEKALEKAQHFSRKIKKKSATFGLPNMTNFSEDNNTGLVGNTEAGSIGSAVCSTPDPLSSANIHPTTRSSSAALENLPTSTQRSKSPPAVQRASSCKINKKLFHLQLSYENHNFNMTSDVARLIDRQSIYIAELKRSAEKQSNLMQRQLELLQKQTLVIERQAVALEGMSSF